MVIEHRNTDGVYVAVNHTYGIIKVIENGSNSAIIRIIILKYYIFTTLLIIAQNP